MFLDGHGFAEGAPVTVRAEAGGSLPSPLQAGVTYYVVPVGDDRISLSATAGGDAIDLTTVGENVLVIAPLPMAAAISYASALVDDMLPAHVVPLTAPFPPIVKATTAELAAAKLAAITGVKGANLSEATDAAQKRLERWGKGIPIRGTNAPGAANLAANGASLSAAFNDARGWQKFGGL
jgi:hypothetical protein